MKTNQIDFTRVNNDVNGNPRYVCHFLTFIKNGDREQIQNDFAASLSRNPFLFTGFEYDLAMERARTIGGRKFHNKQYGGGIVFQSYNIADTERQILELMEGVLS